MLINGGFNVYNERLASLNSAIETLGIVACARLNRNGLYLFKDSEAYSKAKPSFAWGLWSDLGSSTKGKTKNKEDAIEGYSRFIEIYDSDKKVREDNRTTYYLSSRKSLQARKYAEDRVKVLKGE